MQTDEATTRLAAAELLAAMGSLSLPASPVLRTCLKDENPQMRLQAAIALLLAGQEEEEVYSALRDKPDSAWARVPPELRKLIEARMSNE